MMECNLCSRRIRKTFGGLYCRGCWMWLNRDKEPYAQRAGIEFK